MNQIFDHQLTLFNIYYKLEYTEKLFHFPSLFVIRHLFIELLVILSRFHQLIISFNNMFRSFISLTFHDKERYRKLAIGITEKKNVIM